MTREQKSTVQVYSIDYCPFCIRAKALLTELGIEFEEINISDDPKRRAVTEAILPGHRTAPLVLIDGKPIGGQQDLEAMHARGELEAQVFGAPLDT